MDLTSEYPEFAKAPGLLAYLLLIKADQSRDDPAFLLRLACQSAQNALRLDNANADALTALAQAKLWLHWDWQAAENSYRETLDQNPDHERTLRAYANLLIALGQFNKAEEFAKRASETPDVLMCRLSPGLVAYFRGTEESYVAAEEIFRSAVRDMPTEERARVWLARLLTQKGKFTEAAQILKRSEPGNKFDGKEVVDKEVVDKEAQYARAYNFARAKQTKNALTLLRVFEAEEKKDHASPALIAKVYAGMYEEGQKVEDARRALEYLDKAVNKSDTDLQFLAVDPAWRCLRRNSHFQAVLDRLHLGQVKSPPGMTSVRVP